MKYIFTYFLGVIVMLTLGYISPALLITVAIGFFIALLYYAEKKKEEEKFEDEQFEAAVRAINEEKGTNYKTGSYINEDGEKVRYYY